MRPKDQKHQNLSGRVKLFHANLIPASLHESSGRAPRAKPRASSSASKSSARPYILCIFSRRSVRRSRENTARGAARRSRAIGTLEIASATLPPRSKVSQFSPRAPAHPRARLHNSFPRFAIASRVRALPSLARGGLGRGRRRVRAGISRDLVALGDAIGSGLVRG